MCACGAHLFILEAKGQCQMSSSNYFPLNLLNNIFGWTQSFLIQTGWPAGPEILLSALSGTGTVVHSSILASSLCAPHAAWPALHWPGHFLRSRLLQISTCLLVCIQFCVITTSVTYCQDSEPVQLRVAILLPPSVAILSS